MVWVMIKMSVKIILFENALKYSIMTKARILLTFGGFSSTFGSQGQSYFSDNCDDSISMGKDNTDYGEIISINHSRYHPKVCYSYV